MSISIIIPTYNRAETLRKVVPAYLTDGVLEVLIVNDGSGDSTRSTIEDLARRDHRVRGINHEVNRGPAAARNTGIAAAQGDFIFFGEDDAYPAKGALATLLQCATDGGGDLVGPRLIYMQVNQTEEDALAFTKKGPAVDLDRMLFQYNTVLAGDVPSLHALMLVRRDVFSTVSFDERFVGSAWGEETDFCFSAAKVGRKILFCPEAVVFHLPRLRTGGAWARSRWAYETTALRNQAYLLRKHNEFLREAGYISRSVGRLLLTFGLRRVAFNGRLAVRSLLGEERFSGAVRVIRGTTAASSSETHR